MLLLDHRPVRFSKTRKEEGVKVRVDKRKADWITSDFEMTLNHDVSFSGLRICGVIPQVSPRYGGETSGRCRGVIDDVAWEGLMLTCTTSMLSSKPIDRALTLVMHFM
jgi:hypothetical protein